jgi:hypothetical protein
MTNFTAIYDACVLYPAPLRDFLLRLAMTELFRARWTDRIHEEWMRSVLNHREDLSAEQLDRTRQLMDRAVPDCLLLTTGISLLVWSFLTLTIGMCWLQRHDARPVSSSPSILMTFPAIS